VSRIINLVQTLAILACFVTCMPLWGQDDPLRPPAIEAQDVPAVPAALAERLDQYQNMRAAGFAGWDPQGDGMLIRTRFGNSVQLHRIYTPGGRREQITFFDEPVSGRFIPSQQDGAILLSMSSGGDENYQVYLLDRAKFRTQLLTDGKSRNSLGPIRRDGKQMVIGSNRRNGRDTDLYLADPRQAVSMQMLMEVDKQFWSAVDWSQDGQKLLLNRFVSATESYPSLLDISTGERSELPLAADEPASYGPMAFAPDGESVYVATDAIGEFSRLGRLDLKTGKYEWLTADIDWDVQGLEVDRQTGRVAAVLNEDGASRLLLWDPEGKRLTRREPVLPLGIVSSLEFSPDGKQLGFTLARPDAPADAYSLELSTGEVTRWTYSEVGGLDPASFVVPRRIKYKSFDGREIPAWYYSPSTGKEKAPVLILIHGGPESQFQPYFSGTLQYYVKELGLAVIAPNVRGSSGYGKTYLKLDNAELREDSVKDIGALLDWIAKQPDLDASRVAVSGGSYGGYMTLASLVHFSDRIKAGIDNVGIANFVTFLEKTAAYRVDLRRVEYGDERDPPMRELLLKISPATNADRIRSALLVAHGVNDPRVPFAEAQQIAEKVRAQGKPVWTVYANNEGHGFAKKDNSDYLRAVEAMFLARFLDIQLPDEMNGQ
jgi:dipeptidyl aminopeptidase/acylaminoacyl peptidase